MFPKIASAKDLQKGYRAMFDDVKRSGEPLFIMKNNKPEMVILEITMYEDLITKAKQEEEALARAVLADYAKAKKEETMQRVQSLAELDED